MISKMVPRSADGVLTYLEKNAADELSYLASVGAEYFSTADLIRLRGQWEVKNQFFGYLQRLLIYTAAISPVWIVSFFLLFFLKVKVLAFLSLLMFPLSFAIFFGGLFIMRRLFPGKGHLDYIGDVIALELQRRQYIKC